jgi:hypothetical protein
MELEMTLALLLRLSRFCVNRMPRAQSCNKSDNGRRADPSAPFGNVKADVLADPHFQGGNFCRVIRASHRHG